ncbi:transposase, partial [Glaesserella parasuis]
MKITHCKLKKSIQKKLLEFFVLEVTARSAADLLGIQPNSAILFYRKIREVICYHLALEADEVFDGQIELDESYFGGHREGKRGRGAAGKVAVLGILKRQGKVFTVVVNDTQTTTPMPVIA